MGLEIYNFVVSILGELPNELNFLYAIGTLFVFVLICYCAVVPYILIFKVWSD